MDSSLCDRVLEAIGRVCSAFCVDIRYELIESDTTIDYKALLKTQIRSTGPRIEIATEFREGCCPSKREIN